MKTVYRGMRIKREENAKSLLSEGMGYYWQNSERTVSDIYRVLKKFHKISKLGNTPLLRDFILEACRPNRLQIWGTQDKDNANSYARSSPELIYLVLDAIGKTRDEARKYLDERFGHPHVVTFSINEPDNGRCEINTVYGRFVEPERILSVEKIDTTCPDPFFARFKKENTIAKYEMVALKN